MEANLKQWWENGAEKMVADCLDYIQNRKNALDEYKKHIIECNDQDNILLQEFNEDIKNIKKHIKTIDKPYLKHQENFFVICLKSRLFKFALKSAEIQSIADICDGLKNVYIDMYIT